MQKIKKKQSKAFYYVFCTILHLYENKQSIVKTWPSIPIIKATRRYGMALILLAPERTVLLGDRSTRGSGLVLSLGVP